MEQPVSMTVGEKPDGGVRAGHGEMASRPDMRPGSDAVRLRAIVEMSVGQAFGVSAAELRSTTRGRARTALARQVAMYLSHVVCGRTLTDVGHLFARDRTTVAHACAHIEDRRDDPRFDRILELLESIVRWRLGACGWASIGT